MANEFKLPELGENITTADIVKVLIKPGDKVEIDQAVVEIETDKANVEVPSEISGTVKEVMVKEGSKANVGDVIFTLEQDISDEKKPAEKKEPEAELKEPEKKTEKVEKVVKTEPVKPSAKESITTSTYEFKLPELGENITTAQITKVLVKKGEKVKKDDVLIEIETDKATVEVPSEVDGTVKEVKIKDGDTANVGEVIIIFDAPGIVIPEPKKEAPTQPKQQISEQARKELARTLKENEGTSEKKRISRADLSGKTAPAAPSVRRFAREIGIDIHQVSGTGPGGRISVDDVKAFSKNLNQKISQAASAGVPIGINKESLPDFSKYGEVEIKQMTNIRRKTAEHLSYAWSTIPHVTQFDKADITELEKLRKQYSKQVEAAGGKLTVTAILLKILASALKVFPQFNSSIDMDKKEIIYKKYYNIGIAVDTDRGLLVPVVRDVDKKNIIQLSVELSEISVKARDKKLTIEDMQGGNFSISNLGGIGGTYFTPIVNSPEVAILGVSRGSYEQVYKDGQFIPRMILPLSLSYDHRIIDGADAARFIRWVCKALENPFLLSLEG
ncbi:MAG: dihydrolipoyllysine-residue acetyltransferase [Melioribacteraceae bacterium]|nr:dihydrolipoyllysine-residue acetyltransferase [Melioribacteraceae bacterium]